MGAGGQGEVGADQSLAGDRVWMLHWSHFGVSGSIGISLMLHWSHFGVPGSIGISSPSLARNYVL